MATSHFLWSRHWSFAYNAMEPQSLAWLHGFATVVCLLCYTNCLSKSIHHPYGSTIKRAQCYGAPKPSVAPWLRHPGLASYGTPIAKEVISPPLWVDHETHTMLWSHRAINGSMASPLHVASFGTPFVYEINGAPCAHKTKY